ncbi:hypothetical protein Tco_0534663 [Tanacetum coccineum]
MLPYTPTTLAFGLTHSPFLSFKKSFCLHTSPFLLDLVLLLPILGPGYITPNQQKEAHYFLMLLLVTLMQGGSSMGASNGGSASSIALLQERFNQLQKMKEKRRENELLKLFPEHETKRQTNLYEPPATRPSLQDSVSLGLDLYTKKAEPQKPAKDPQVMDFWSANDKPEVDTSLHL